MSVGGGLRRFCRALLALEGWTPRNDALMEAVVKHVRTTRHPCVVACDANVDLRELRPGLWFKEERMFIEAPHEDVSIRRSTGSKGELIERACDFVIVSKNLQGQKKNMLWIILSSGRTKAVTFQVEKSSEVQVVR